VKNIGTGGSKCTNGDSFEVVGHTMMMSVFMEMTSMPSTRTTVSKSMRTKL
jgi:hypothetical protein